MKHKLLKKRLSLFGICPSTILILFTLKQQKQPTALHPFFPPHLPIHRHPIYNLLPIQSQFYFPQYNHKSLPYFLLSFFMFIQSQPDQYNPTHVNCLQDKGSFMSSRLPTNITMHQENASFSLTLMRQSRGGQNDSNQRILEELGGVEECRKQKMQKKHDFQLHQSVFLNLNDRQLLREQQQQQLKRKWEMRPQERVGNNCEGGEINQNEGEGNGRIEGVVNVDGEVIDNCFKESRLVENEGNVIKREIQERREENRLEGVKLVEAKTNYTLQSIKNTNIGKSKVQLTQTSILKNTKIPEIVESSIQLDNNTLPQNTPIPSKQKLNLLHFDSSSSHQIRNTSRNVSSIENIINQFSKKYDREYNFQDHCGHRDHHKQFKEQLSVHSQRDNMDDGECDLGLDSFERDISLPNQSRQRNTKQSMRISNRSNISQQDDEQLKERNQIWQRDEFVLPFDKVNQIKQTNRMSINSSLQNCCDELERRSKAERDRLVVVEGQNLELRAEVLKLGEKVKEIQGLKNQFRERSVNAEVRILEGQQRESQLLEENKELNNVVQGYKQELYLRELAEAKLSARLRESENNLANYQAKILSKDEDIEQLLRTIEEGDEQIETGNNIAQELKALLNGKETQLKHCREQLQGELQSSREEILFYKNRLESEGFVLQVEEVKELKDIIERKESEEQANLIKIQGKYKNIIYQLTRQNQKYRNQHLQMAKKDKQAIASQLTAIISNYDSQLQRRDQQILQLKTALKQYQSVSTHSTHLTPSLLAKIEHFSKISVHNQTPPRGQLIFAEFISVVDKLMRAVHVCEYELQSLKAERGKMMNRLVNLDREYGLDLEKVTKERNGLDQINFQMNSKIMALERQCQLLRRKLQQQELLSQKNNEVKCKSCECLEEKSRKFEEKYLKLKLYSESLQKKMKEKTKNGEFYSQKMVSCNDKSFGVSQGSQSLSKDLRLYQSSQQRRAKQNSLNAKQKGQLTEQSQYQQDRPLIQFLSSSYNFREGQRQMLVLAIIKAAIEQLKGNKKLSALIPSQIRVNTQCKQWKIIICGFMGQSQCSQFNLLYRAPQVLLSFPESQSSYVWSLGIMIDQLYNGRLYYHKINEVMSRHKNYKCANSQLPFFSLLQQMLQKNQKHRPSIYQIFQYFSNAK